MECYLLKTIFRRPRTWMLFVSLSSELMCTEGFDINATRVEFLTNEKNFSRKAITIIKTAYGYVLLSLFNALSLRNKNPTDAHMYS